MKSITTAIKSIAFLVGVLTITAVSPARADLNIGNPGIFPSQSSPYAESCGQWAADWWTGALSIPTYA